MKRCKDGKGYELFDITGEPLEVNGDGEYTEIPERCPECRCTQAENWKEFTAKTVHVCMQCGHEMNIIY